MPAYLAVPAPSAILPAPFRCAGDRGSDSIFFRIGSESLPRRLLLLLETSIRFFLLSWPIPTSQRWCHCCQRVSLPCSLRTAHARTNTHTHASSTDSPLGQSREPIMHNVCACTPARRRFTHAVRASALLVPPSDRDGAMEREMLGGFKKERSTANNPPWDP